MGDEGMERILARSSHRAHAARKEGVTRRLLQLPQPVYFGPPQICEEIALMRSFRLKSHLFFLLLLWTSLACAQQGNVATPNPAGFDPAVEKLKAITVLPLPEWRVKRSEEHTSELQSHSFISYA